jgi:hypothetical protein
MSFFVPWNANFFGGLQISCRDERDKWPRQAKFPCLRTFSSCNGFRTLCYFPVTSALLPRYFRALVDSAEVAGKSYFLMPC